MFVLMFLSSGVFGAEYYVDNVKGNDANPGTVDKPFKDPFQGLKVMKSGDTLHFVANSTPYFLSKPFRVDITGTEENPTVVDGHGAVVSGLKHRSSKEWKSEGNDIYSFYLQNNAHVMDKCWQGGFPLVFFDGKAGKNFQSLAELEPLGYFLYKNRKNRKDPKHDMLYIKLPPGKNPDQIEVKTLSWSNIGTGSDFVTIRNFISEYTTMDGFSTGGGNGKQVCGNGIVFENCESRFCMDQGISHHGSVVSAKNCWFHHNAGCGIVDVYPVCRSSYYNCLIENDTYRGGVEFQRGEHLLENCIIRYNSRAALGISKNARLKVKNCLFIGRKDGSSTGLSIGSDAGKTTIENCTFYGFKVAVVLNFQQKADTNVTIKNCAFINCEMNYRVTRVNIDKEQEAPSIKCDYNAMTPAKSYFQIYDKLNRKTDFLKNFAAADFKSFKEKTGFETHSVIINQKFTSPPYSLPDLMGKGENGGNIGANLDFSQVGVNKNKF
jgi:hypothetical protein